MMNAPKSSLPAIFEILPRLGDSSIRPQGPGSDGICLTAVAYEEIYWDTIERLKSQGATSILVLPIEKVLS
jgi:ATP phosphoribosyltransferase